MNKLIIQTAVLGLLLILTAGCKDKTPAYSVREAAGEVPQVKMGDEEAQETVDVAALLHDLRSQIETLEDGISGKDPTMLQPIEESINGLRIMMDGIEPAARDAVSMLKDIEEQLETLKSGMEE